MIKINLGLQGGGAHGAFTWGVLDRLLDEEDIEIAAISGTSAGALNGAAFKAGWTANGRDGARENLDWLWSKMGALEGLWPAWLDAWLPDPSVTSRALDASPLLLWGDIMARMGTPYAMGPFYSNPLERMVQEFNFDNVCDTNGPRLFVGATCVQDGKIRIFSGDKVTTNAILASACLPTLFQAVRCPDPETGIEEAFWDGGYTGNPPLFPLYQPDLPDDVLIVSINPMKRDVEPTMPNEIHNRINEISFNSSLLSDLRAIAFVQRLIKDKTIPAGAMKNVRVHMVADDELMRDLSVATKLVPMPSLLKQLKEAGRVAADGFLAAHKDDLGKRQTTDLRAMFG